MSRDPRLYGWYVTSAAQFEPIMTLVDIAPANLLRFVPVVIQLIARLRDVLAKKLM